MVIYIVTSGAYSSYGINSVFSTREKAETYIKNMPHKDDTERIEEFTVDEEDCAMVHVIYSATIRLKDGVITRKGSVEHYGSKAELEQPRSWSVPHHPVPEHLQNIVESFVEVSSLVSQEHAVKLAVEHRQRWLREKSAQEVYKMTGHDPSCGTLDDRNFCTCGFDLQF
jgi:hypothetical protein